MKRMLWSLPGNDVKTGPSTFFLQEHQMSPCLTYHAQREQKHHSKDGVSLQHRPRVPSSFSSEKMLVQKLRRGFHMCTIMCGRHSETPVSKGRTTFVEQPLLCYVCDEYSIIHQGGEIVFFILQAQPQTRRDEHSITRKP